MVGQPDNRPWWQKIFEGGYAGTVDPALGPQAIAPVNPALTPGVAPGVQSNPYLTMPMDQRGSATGNGEYGIPQPFAMNPNVNPPQNPAQDDLANSRYRYMRQNEMPVSPPEPAGLPQTAPLPPRRPQPPSAFTSLKAPPGVGVTPPTPAPAPTPAPQNGRDYEYYQYENDAGNLVWGTRPKGYQGAMPGSNPAGYAAQGFDRPGSGMSFDQANQFQQLRPAGQPTGGAGTGVRDFFSGLKAPPGTHRAPAPPPGSPQSGAPQTAFSTPYGPMIPEGPGTVVPSDYNQDGQGYTGQGVPGAPQQPQQQPQQPNVIGMTQQGQPILSGDPQAGLPDWMKGSSMANFLQFLGMGGGF